MLTIFIAFLKEAPQPLDIFNNPNALGLMSIGVGIAAIIVAILVGIYQVRQGRIRRTLAYHLLSNGSIVTINSAVANQVEIDIRVKGVSVKDAHLIVLLIKNSGNASIHSVDYFEPLTFEFDNQVLSASVLETTPPTLINPKDIPAFLTLTPQSVQFPTFPLNPNDAVQINVLLEGKGTMTVRGRLDQGRIVPFEPEKGNRLSKLLVVVAVAGGVLVLGALGSVEAAGGKVVGVSALVLILIGAVGLGLMGIVMLIAMAKVLVDIVKEIMHYYYPW